MIEPTAADIIHFTRLLAYTQYAISLLWSGIVTALQTQAFRRHGTSSFLLLAFGTIFGILMLIFGVAPTFLRFTPVSWLSFHLLSFFFFCAQVVTGLLGIIKLFRDYQELAATCTRLPKTFPERPREAP